MSLGLAVRYNTRFMVHFCPSVPYAIRGRYGRFYHFPPALIRLHAPGISIDTFFAGSRGLDIGFERRIVLFSSRNAILARFICKSSIKSRKTGSERKEEGDATRSEKSGNVLKVFLPNQKYQLSEKRQSSSKSLFIMNFIESFVFPCAPVCAVCFLYITCPYLPAPYNTHTYPVVVVVFFPRKRANKLA